MAPVRSLKGSEEPRKKLSGWLVFSNPGSSPSTSATPKNSDSEKTPPKDSAPAPINSAQSQDS